MLSEGTHTGLYRTPFIGEESPIQDAEHHISIDPQNVITVTSPLWEDPYSIGDGATFTDPRADRFLQLATLHQFHHFTTRQLSLTEEYETRSGTSRFVRLGGVLDSARLLQSLGATFEQIVQAAVSDFGHPVGSHLRGDYMVGDYANQDSHDKDLWAYLNGSGFVKALEYEGLIELDGHLVGSPLKLEELSDPRKPRWEDIVECERPDGNADRIPFTLHEGVLIHDSAEIRETMAAVVRVETKSGERMAMNDIEAARLLFKLAVRHQSENWGEPLHRVVEELVLLPDRYAFCAPHEGQGQFRQLQDYYPVDYARTDESTWNEIINELGAIDPFIPSVLAIAKFIASHQWEVTDKYVNDPNAYSGPNPPLGVEIHQGTNRKRGLVSIEESEDRGSREIWVALPAPRYRGPIDSLVVTKRGLVRISEIDPELNEYADRRRKWMTPLLAKITVPFAVGREIQYGLSLVNRYWSNTKANPMYVNPTTRRPMPSGILEEQVALARARVFKDALVK